MTAATPAAVSATPAVLALIRAAAGPPRPADVPQSGGCCDGSAPLCYPDGDFIVGARDVLLGVLDGCKFWIGGDQYALWKHTTLILDVVPGRGAGFSLEAPEGLRFLIRSDVCAVPP